MQDRQLIEEALALMARECRAKARFEYVMGRTALSASYEERAARCDALIAAHAETPQKKRATLRLQNDGPVPAAG